MNQGGKILWAIRELTTMFETHCEDAETLVDIRSIAADPNKWKQAHSLFQRIRRKNNEATKLGNDALACQYTFEEACAKTLYNLSMAEAPFDPDSPYWVVPTAFALARRIGISDTSVLERIGV